MPLALGFDYGLSRIGVATGQTLTQTASPLTALPAQNGTPQWETVEQLLRMEADGVTTASLQDGTMRNGSSREKIRPMHSGRFGCRSIC